MEILLKDINQIPYNARVLIWGNGQNGKFLYNKLKKRIDLQIIGFIDKCKNESTSNINCYSADEFDRKSLKEHCIIVTPIHWLDKIRKELKEYCVDSYYINTITKISHEFKYSKYSYSDITKVCEYFSDINSKKAWMSMMGCITGRNYTRITSDTNINYNNQYFEFLDLKEGSVVIDGGAYHFSTLERFADIVGENGKVIAIDPLIRSNENISSGKNIVSIKKALWKKNKKMLFLNQFGPSSCLLKFNLKAIKMAINLFITLVKKRSLGNIVESVLNQMDIIEATTIDSLIDKLKLCRVDLLKLDIEGAEIEALRGALNVIERYKPTLAIAVYHRLSDYFEIINFIKILDLGYEFKFNCYSKGWTEAILYALPSNKRETI